MACEIVKTDGPVLHVRINGKLQFADQQAVQAAAKRLIAQRIKPRLLVVSDNFQGWEKQGDWAMLAF